MNEVIQIEDTASTIAQALTEYDQEVADKTKKVVDKVSKETVERLQQISPKRTGVYAESWKRKKAYEDTRTKRNTVYNPKKYQLTHLLEYGHSSKYGEVKGIPHILIANKEAAEKLEQGIKRTLE